LKHYVHINGCPLQVSQNVVTFVLLVVSGWPFTVAWTKR